MIDFHAHCPSERGLWGLGPPYPGRDYLAFMDAVGISATTIFTMDGLIYPTPGTNDEVATFVAADRSRLIGFGTIEPRLSDSLDEAERCITTLGFAGFKVHPLLQGLAPDEPGTRLDAMCEMLAERRGVMMFHDGSPPYSTALQIAVLARRHPRVAFVLGHAGGHDLWREAIAAVVAHPNVYACLGTSAWLVTRRIVETCPISQMLFGTDAGLGPIDAQTYVGRRIRAFRAHGFGQDLERIILEENPGRLLDGFIN
jgi:uncharacterized protein